MLGSHSAAFQSHGLSLSRLALPPGQGKLANPAVLTATLSPEAGEGSKFSWDGSGALHEISCVANSISWDLEKVMQRCGSIRGACADDVTSLREIRCVTRAVHEDLRKLEESRLAGPAAAAPRDAYDDPHLARARKIAGLTNRLCEDLDSTSSIFGTAARIAAEAASLQEISSVTQKVCEDMRRLQAETWATSVLSNVPSSAMEAAEDRGLPYGSIAGAKPPGKGDVASALAEESTSGAASPAAASASATAGSPAAAPGARGVESGGTSGGPGRVRRGTTRAEEFAAVQEFLAQQGSDELSEAELRRMQTAFKRFKVPDSNDLHTSDVCGLLQYLGHVLTDEEIVGPLIKEVTSYDYLDFEEFLTFMEHYKPKERDQFHVVFEKYDQDNSGEISILELKTMLSDLRFIPLRKMMTEALSVADQSGNGQLDYQEFVTFLAVYRRFEGFCTDEVAELDSIYGKFSTSGDASSAGLMPADQLADALVQVFGLHVSELAESLEQQLKSGQGLQKSAYLAGGSTGRPESLTFPEFLVFARKTREASLHKLRGDYPALANRQAGDAIICGAGDEDTQQQGAFDAHDTDGNGGISIQELRAALQSMGFTPLQQNLDEILAEVQRDSGRELDFDEFFDFMLIFRQREGFQKQVVEEMRKVFDRFDSDGSAEINALELADLFRELGYHATMEEIHGFVLQMDANGSNQLDFPEFMKLMRLHREQELTRISAVFESFKDRQKNVILSMDVKASLEWMGHQVPPPLLEGRRRHADFDWFVHLADACRADRVAREKRKAGFSDEKIAHFEDLFNRFDRDRSGEIDTFELLGILKEFDWEPKTREEQQALVNKLDTARARAREAGVQGVSTDGSTAINLWTFVQLTRILETEYDQAEEERLRRLMAELRFSEKEVEEFRLIFHDKKKSIASEQASPDPDGDSKGLPRQAIRRLVFVIGVDLKGERKAALDERLQALGCTDDRPLDFHGFLRLMRWLMETGWLPQ